MNRLVLIDGNAILHRAFHALPPLSTKDGKIEEKFPTNPNGAMHNIAAICNKKGNVMAIMPHPERASFIRQLPDIVELKNKSSGSIFEMEKPAPAMNLFKSMKDYIEEEIL